MDRFIFNSEQHANSYGFKIKTSGISLERFLANPVMLDGHIPSTQFVIGRWENVQEVAGTLSAAAVFDDDDERAAVIAGKVARGMVRACSMGISFNREDLTYVDGELWLLKCELLEVSIVAVPSHSQALRLYEDGQLLSDDVVTHLCLSLNSQQNQSDINMKRLKLSQLAFIALGFASTTEEASVEEVSQAILALEQAKNEAESKLQLSEEKVDAYLQKEQAAQLQSATDMVALAIQKGQLAADKKQAFVDLAHQDFELATQIIAALPARKNFGAGVNTPAGVSAVTSMEEFQKLSISEQLAFKNANPSAYQEILKTI